MKPLDQQLADMSACAKDAADTFDAARRETHDRVVARREQARASAAAFADRVDKDIQEVGDWMSGQWNALQAKVASDISRLKATVEQRQHDRGVERAVKHADRLESEASVAIDFALASIEDAKRAVLDAVAARIEAAAADGT
jgi:DNA polymerase II small subunit/DNA polymerase delta subunit B